MSPKSFFQDGISVKEMIILSAVINIPLSIVINSIFLFNIINRLPADLLDKNLKIIIDFMMSNNFYIIVPYLIIVSFYFLNDRTADIIKLWLMKQENKDE